MQCYPYSISGNLDTVWRQIFVALKFCKIEDILVFKIWFTTTFFFLFFSQLSRTSLFVLLMGLRVTAGHLGKVASTAWCNEEVILKYLTGSSSNPGSISQHCSIWDSKIRTHFTSYTLQKFLFPIKMFVIKIFVIAGLLRKLQKFYATKIWRYTVHTCSFANNKYRLYTYSRAMHTYSSTNSYRGFSTLQHRRQNSKSVEGHMAYWPKNVFYSPYKEG